MPSPAHPFLKRDWWHGRIQVVAEVIGCLHLRAAPGPLPTFRRSPARVFSMSIAWFDLPHPRTSNLLTGLELKMRVLMLLAIKPPSKHFFCGGHLGLHLFITDRES
jgi:hypothetical protein